MRTREQVRPLTKRGAAPGCASCANFLMYTATTIIHIWGRMIGYQLLSDFKKNKYEKEASNDY